MDIIHALDDEKVQQIASMPLYSVSNSFNPNRRLNAGNVSFSSAPLRLAFS